MKSEFLHAFLVTERVVTHLPVQVTEGANTLEAAGLAYDNGRRLLELTGRLKAPHRGADDAQAMTTLPPLVFITGASSGIGQALAARAARDGWRLALVARRGDALRAWAAGQGLGPERCAVYEADVQEIDSIVAAGQACIAQQGLPDVVIANAGISVGVDSADRARPAALRDTWPPTPPAWRRPSAPSSTRCAGGRSGTAGGHCQHGGHSRVARAWRLLRQQGGRGGLLRKPARRVPGLRRAGGHAAARLHRHAADGEATRTACRS
jgi:hypothetical protein